MRSRTPKFSCGRADKNERSEPYLNRPTAATHVISVPQPDGHQKMRIPRLFVLLARFVANNAIPLLTAWWRTELKGN